LLHYYILNTLVFFIADGRGDTIMVFDEIIGKWKYAARADNADKQIDQAFVWVTALSC